LRFACRLIRAQEMKQTYLLIANDATAHVLLYAIGRESRALSARIA
jgi:hypothetical protein